MSELEQRLVALGRAARRPRGARPRCARARAHRRARGAAPAPASPRARARRARARRAARDARHPGCALRAPSLPADRRRSDRARRRAPADGRRARRSSSSCSASASRSPRRGSEAAFDLLELDEEPDAVYLGDRGTVWFLYGTPDAVRLLRRADARARGRRAVRPQEARGGGHARSSGASVRGAPAYFLSGEPHVVMLLDELGDGVPESRTARAGRARLGGGRTHRAPRGRPHARRGARPGRLAALTRPARAASLRACCRRPSGSSSWSSTPSRGRSISSSRCS